MVFILRRDMRRIPAEHTALAESIRTAQELSLQQGPLPIPEEKLQEIIKKVVKTVFESLIAASQMRAFLDPSLAVTARMITIAQDSRAGRTGTDDAVDQVVRRSGEKPVMQGSLLRVVYDISTLTLENKIPFAKPEPSLADVHVSAILFAARPLLEELQQAGASL
jgi:hypothetical protein